MLLPVLGSLLMVDTLVLDSVEVDVYEESSIQYYPSARQQSITVPNLVLDRVHYAHPFLEFFEYVLAPRCLRAFAAECWTRDHIPAITRFLRCGASSNLLSVSIDLDPPRRYGDDASDIEGTIHSPVAVYDPSLIVMPCRRRRDGRLHRRILTLHPAPMRTNRLQMPRLRDRSHAPVIVAEYPHFPTHHAPRLRDPDLDVFWRVLAAALCRSARFR